jgi:hypothetical protein
LPFGISRNEQLEQLIGPEDFVPMAVKTIISIVAVINPETVVLTGELIHPELLEDIESGCLDFIPDKHMPRIIFRENIHEDYINGLISVTIDSMACDVRLVKKRM